MSHYSKFEEDKFFKSLHICPPFSPPVGNIDDVLGFENRNIQDSLLVNSGETFCISSEGLPRKHIFGKAQGARFCYIGHLAAVSEFSGCVEDYLSNALDNLINFDSSDKDFTEVISSIINHAGVAMGGQEELWNGVIAVRNHALKSGKYTPESYKERIDTTLLLDAMARHLIAYLFVGKLDKESGINHMAHIVANVVMYAVQMELPI